MCKYAYKHIYSDLFISESSKLALICKKQKNYQPVDHCIRKIACYEFTVSCICLRSLSLLKANPRKISLINKIDVYILLMKVKAFAETAFLIEEKQWKIVNIYDRDI